MLDARPGFIIKFLKRSLIVNLFKTQAFDCQSAVFDYLSKTADWQSKACVLNKFTIRERFRNFNVILATK
jgi:hypothetical protein